MIKKSIKKIVLSSLVLPLVLGTAFASYPDKPIKMLVGYAPGSSTDIVGRMVANELSIALKQSVIVENRGGAAGSLAADAVAKSAPDGYTVLFAQNGLAINVAANPRLPFNGQKDLLPVVGVAATPHILIVNNNSKAKNVADLIAMLRAEPGKMSFGSSGIGNSDHMAGELFLATTGTQAIHIPYKGGAAAMLDLMAGQVPMMFVNFDSAVPHVKAGKMRAIAVTSLTRRQALPDVPTVAESGFPGFEAESWTAISGPPNMPAALVLRINELLIRIAQMPDVREKFAALGLEASLLKPDAMKQFVKQEVDKWGKAVRASGATVD
jgi:tripartite-type tricarboxylate transporter receptor subunit TctC